MNDDLKTAQNIWQAVLGKIELRIPKSSYETWLENTSGLALKDNQITVNVENAFTAQYLEDRMIGMLQREVSNIVGLSTTVKFTVNSETEFKEISATTKTLITKETPSFTHGYIPKPLNHKYQFDNFIVGDTNKLAYAGTQAVSESPGTAFNPLVIYSNVGLGKTHLLHATGHVLIKKGLKVIYITSEEFTNHYVSAIKNQTTDEFRSLFRQIDALLIDDLQFLIGKEQTQEGFFHTFNELHMQNKQIIVALDRPLAQLHLLEDRITSRLAGGLITDIEKPSYETRLAILHAKSDALYMNFPNNILELLAQRSFSNIRQLEGSLNRVAAWSQFTGEKATSSALLEFVENDVSLLANNHKTFTSDDVIQAVSNHFNVSPEHIKSKQRRKSYLIPRQIIMFLLREETSMSLSEIGKILGNRDHSTVLHGYDKMSSLINIDNNLKQEILTIKDNLIRI
jgi:chromosomal replication initiator protein